MKIARFWAKESATTTRGRSRYRLRVWEWSENSLDEARAKARASLQRLVQRVQTEGFAGHPPTRTYGYGDKPPREEIIEEIRDSHGVTIATISRNIYGALILNTPALMFIDIDIPPESPFAGLRSFFARIFGQKIESQAEKVERRIAATRAAHKSLRLRVYRTAAGFRCAVSGRAIEPDSPLAQQLFEECGADPLYVRLSTSQKCYRARLTPKPWRVHCPPPPNRFPWDTPQEEQKYRDWQREYSRCSEGRAVCKFIGTDSHPETDGGTIETLLNLHDRYTRVESTLPLA